MTPRLVMGIDAGNTKTLAVLADEKGQVLGYGRSGPANIYSGLAGAVETIQNVQAQALAAVGATGVDHLALSATGADWPEDFADLRCALEGRTAQTLGELSLVNDAVAALWTGSATGEGVAVALGTSAGTAARHGDRVWHSSFWQDPEGAVQLGKKALRAVYRAHLGLSPATTLTRAVLKHFELHDVEAVLHAFTARTRNLGESDAGSLARLLLSEAEAGDGVARCLVTGHAEALAGYVTVAARKVGLAGRPFALVLAGGVTRHPGQLLPNTLLRRVLETEPGATLCPPAFEPVGGAVCIALDALGIHTAEARSTLKATLPTRTFYAT